MESRQWSYGLFSSVKSLDIFNFKGSLDTLHKIVMATNWIPHPTVLHGTLVDLIPLEEFHFEESYYREQKDKSK